MEILMLLSPGWLYAAVNLTRIPYKIFCMLRAPQTMWRLPSTRALLCYAWVYAVTGPVPALFAGALLARGVGGSNGRSLDSIVLFAWMALMLFLAVAVVALLIACVRPLVRGVAGAPKRHRMRN
ncbi:hypothetical protein LGN09_06965 [Burkholderia cenocepacia]|uniref:hypothetical protein n=1 Tax=Burkholderia cenocepacia TaxID=95486 RepID=UPI001CF3ABBA|nr:hypothetical protein [Burkholderia cenocepacia]MCA8404624.1 hypothetical protein [Burkholderia cenocepacia]